MRERSCCASISRALPSTMRSSALARRLCRPISPRAGLHFTPALVDRLARRGVSLHRVTLHVGPGTFLPVKVEDTRDHRMHAEEGAVDAATAAALNTTRQNGGRIVCVGTTSARSTC